MMSIIHKAIHLIYSIKGHVNGNFFQMSKNKKIVYIYQKINMYFYVIRVQFLF